MSHRLSIHNLGPIKKADIEFGDLTVFVGPQATGKSIALQMLKLLLDRGSILRALRDAGLNWDRDPGEFLDLYFGEGMRRIWSDQTQIAWQGRPVHLSQLVKARGGIPEERCFFIPAQRVLALSREGWVRPFGEYRGGDPFTLRDFSNTLHEQMNSRQGAPGLFRENLHMKGTIRRMLNDAIFSGFHLKIEKHGTQKRLVLGKAISIGRPSPSLFSQDLPFMVWSAGQREFVPLLLGLNWLTPPQKTGRRDGLEWVVIEEMEMGLHPKGIEAMLVIVLDLLARGYKVCISTHSPQVLDLVWALRVLRQNKAPASDVLRLFGLEKSADMMPSAQAALEASVSVYYFDRKTHAARNISMLDPGADDADEADWGGLTGFSSRAQEVVASAVSRGGSA